MNEIVSFVSANPVAVLTDEVKYSEFYRAIKAEIASFVPDISTERGRKDIKSLAYKITRSKTAIDDAGKKLNEEARAKINVVDASRRKIRDELDALADEVRRPVTEWETAEDARKDEAAADLKKIADLSIVLASDAAEAIKAKWDSLNLMILRDDVHLDGIDHARASLESALDSLEAARARAQKAEDDQKELARLRAEQEAREIAERQPREKAEAERLEKERREKADAEYKANVARAAEEARQAEIAKAKAENERIEREARAAVERAESEARAIREKAEREERERREAIERTKREEEARQKDRAHRSRLMGEAKSAIMTCGADEETAKKIVLAIIASEVPHVSLRF